MLNEATSRRLRGAIVVFVLTASALPGTVYAEDPAFIGWTGLLPGLTEGYDPSSDNLCKKGHDQCVHAVIKEMTQRFDKLATECDHDAVFALTYLRTTEVYHEASHIPGFFQDPGFVNHEDAVFASYYFDAWDDWHKGKQAFVPPAWKVAFDAADKRAVSGRGNVLLGMNAHIQRDLPFVLAAIGLVAPDGSSRKPDHDKVNEFLNTVSDELFPELACRFDPTVASGNLPGTLDDAATFQVVPAWRELAWRNAERLVGAPTQAEWDAVAQSIEDYAHVHALLLRAQYAYGPLGSSTARDQFCAQHHDDVCQ